jgi:hypothetical protein
MRWRLIHTHDDEVGFPPECELAAIGYAHGAIAVARGRTESFLGGWFTPIALA